MLSITRSLIRTSFRNMAYLVSKFQDVKSATHNKNIVVIDVREPDELRESGEIPHSINIPLASVENIFKNLSNEEFISAYGRSKPDTHTEMIISCRSGKRSEMAQNILQQLGYKKVYNYSGGWLDWEKNNTSQQN